MEYERRNQMLPMSEHPTYLTESWVQFGPAMVSNSAHVRLEIKCNGKASSQKATTSDNGKWNLRDSVRGAYHGLRTLFRSSQGRGAPAVSMVDDAKVTDQPGLTIFSGADIASSVHIVHILHTVHSAHESRIARIVHKAMCTLRTVWIWYTLHTLRRSVHFVSTVHVCIARNLHTALIVCTVRTCPHCIQCAHFT